MRNLRRFFVLGSLGLFFVMGAAFPASACVREARALCHELNPSISERKASAPINAEEREVGGHSRAAYFVSCRNDTKHILNPDCSEQGKSASGIK